MSLTGIPSRLIGRSEGRPPALWPSSRTIPARWAVRRANGRRKTRHALGEDAPITQLVSTPPAPEASINNDRRSLSRIDPRAFASKCCGAIWTVRRIPGEKVDCRLSTVTVHARSRRSTPTTFKPAPGDHVIDVFIAPCYRIPSQGVADQHHREQSHPASLAPESNQTPARRLPTAGAVL